MRERERERERERGRERSVLARDRERARQCDSERERERERERRTEIHEYMDEGMNLLSVISDAFPFFIPSHPPSISHLLSLSLFECLFLLRLSSP